MGYFNQPKYTLRRKVFKLFGGEFHIRDSSDNIVGFAKQKAFKLKEDITVYSDESREKAIMTIQARQILDFSAAYDVIDSDDKKVGALKRKGLKSILKDEWIIMDTNDNEIGKIKEDNALLATVRRFLSNLIPQDYGVYQEGNEHEFVNIKQHFNPFVYKIDIDFSNNTNNTFNPSLIMAGAVLLAAIEGRQQ